MRTISGNAFFLPAQAVCIPTHAPDRHGRMTMLSGRLLEIALLWPHIDYAIGQRIKKSGHIVQLLSTYNTAIPTISLPVTTPNKPWKTVPLPYHLVMFPTRRGDRNANLNLSLIKESCKQLTVGMDKMRWTNVHIPNFTLSRTDADMWDRVTKILANSLDDRVTLVNPEDEDA